MNYENQNRQHEQRTQQQPQHVKKRVNFRTSVAACLAVIIFGGALGFGGSRLITDALDATHGINNTGNVNRDKDSLPDVLINEPSDNDESETSAQRPASVPRNSDGEYDAAGIYEEFSSTVVGIKITQQGFPDVSDVIGSGVIISDDGFIITCAHVVVGAEKVYVVVDDYDNPDSDEARHEYEASVYGSDTYSDIAVIKIERDEPFRYSEIGKSTDLKVGQTIVAIGNPVGLIKTMTQGIVSGLQRSLGDNPYVLPLIQTDTALNPGNSGCPLFNMKGEVVGIVNSKLVNDELDNLGFAISIDEAMPIISDLTQHGVVTTRPMLGITGMEFNNWDVVGFLVETVRPNTPAAESGLSRNDIIVAINGTDIVTATDIQNIIKSLNVGDIVTVKVVRYNNFGEPQEMEFKFALTNASEE